MTPKLPKRYFLDIHESLSHPQYGSYALCRKKRFWQGTETIITFTTNGIPDAAQKAEIKEYLAAQAWSDKNGKRPYSGLYLRVNRG